MMDEAILRRLRQDHEELKRRCMGLSLEETLAELEAAGVPFDPQAAVRRIQLVARRYDAALRLHVRSLSLEENVRELREAGIDFDPARAAATLRAKIELAKAEREAAEAAQRVGREQALDVETESGPMRERLRAANHLLRVAAKAAEPGTVSSTALRDALQNLAASLARPVLRPGETRRALEDARRAIQQSATLPSGVLEAALEALDEASALTGEAVAPANYAYLFRNLDSDSDQYDREEDLEEMERDARALKILQELAESANEENPEAEAGAAPGARALQFLQELAKIEEDEAE